MTSIVGGLDLGPHMTRRLPAQDATGIPAQFTTGASHTPGHGQALGHPEERGTSTCVPQPHEAGGNGYTLAELEDDLDTPDVHYFLDLFEKIDDEILPIEKFLKT